MARQQQAYQTIRIAAAAGGEGDERGSADNQRSGLATVCLTDNTLVLLHVFENQMKHTTIVSVGRERWIATLSPGCVAMLIACLKKNEKHCVGRVFVFVCVCVCVCVALV